MAWSKDPKIRELVNYSRKHNMKGVVGICFREDGRFEVISAGKDAGNCGLLEPFGDEIFNMIENEKITLPWL